jgi:citrate synthase
MITTEIGQTTVDKITVRGHDLANELIGKIDFIDMMMLVILDRQCSLAEKDMINTILVTVTDHGLTPSALAARLTYTGAPEAPQAAIAAGLLGAGSVFLGAMQNAAEMLAAAVDGVSETATDDEVAAHAAAFVAKRRAARLPLHGLGHNIHVHGDPRIPALQAVSERNGYYGVHWRMLLAIDDVTPQVYSRRLPANTAGAVGAMILAMGLPLHMARGLALVGRCAGLLGHLIEEEEHPTGQELWSLVLQQDSRNVMPSPRTAASTVAAQ